MRVKLSLLPPFTPSKVLLPVPESVKTVTHLKKHLHASLSSISKHAAGFEGYKALRVDIDGFEILGGSEIGIIQEGDVVTVGLYPESSSAATASKKGTKRVRSVSAEEKDEQNSANRTSKKSKRQQLDRADGPKTQENHTHPPSETTRDRAGELHTGAKKMKTSKSRSPFLHVAKESTQPVDGPKQSPVARRLSTSSDSSSSSDQSSSSPSSSEVASDSSDFSSSSSSNASSNSDSDSDSDSSGTSHTPPNVNASELNEYPVKFNPVSNNAVPPGQGKVSTRHRNARRRRALQYKKANDQSLSIPNASPTIVPAAKDASPDQASASTTTFSTPDIVTSAMANRNKKKGFLKEMMAMRGMKTIFGGDMTPEIVDIEAGSSTQQIITSTPIADQGQQAGTATPSQKTPRAHGHSWSNRVVPPSEMDGLPENVFVSSMAFTAPRRQQRKPQSEVFSKKANGHVEEDEEEQAGPVNGEVDTAGQVPTETAQVVQDEGSELLWTKVKIAFDAFEDLTKSSIGSVPPDSLVTWKDVELDLATFTPELKTQIARITSVTGEVLALRKLQRPITYSGEEDGGEEVVAEASENDEVVISLEELDSNLGKWKVVPPGM